MRTEYTEPRKCDEISEMVLSALYKRGRASTSRLRQMTAAESRSIRYRIDEYLAPAGLVREVDRENHPGEDVRIFELTSDGQMYVSDEWTDLTHYAQRHEVLDASRETRNRLDLLHDRFDDLAQRVERVESDHQKHERSVTDRVDDMERSIRGNVGELRHRVDELEKQTDSFVREGNRLEGRVSELEDRTSRHGDRLALIEEIVEEAWARARLWETNWDVRSFLDTGNHAKALVSRVSPFDTERDWRR